MDTPFNNYLKKKMQEKDILLMTHIVLGYPSWETCLQVVETMVKAGVDLMELQIPFSEPMADGPVILRANQKALEQGVTVQQCLDFARKVTETFDIPFFIMSYYNILFKYGVERFAQTLKARNLQGAIVPDLPPEEGQEYLDLMKKHDLTPVLFFSPTTPDSRMKYIASLSKGFIYCLSRKGVTGADTNFSTDLASYLSRCRLATSLPLALGFGIKEKADIDFIKGKADIAVIGSQTIRIVDNEGSGAVGKFIRSLR
ncbi:MAG: tryptophan synthase subunit alpha [Deltaproteobacteria bacterium RBG_13_43_22]|jgi:tryptophan synthase alpha chain|nr:MAG: tryptophan synthase subunit alpha [Deltaproteobacteria bacterium RBG_13_43_22]